MSTSSHRVVIIGGGSAGVTVAARLRRAGVSDVAMVEPSQDHWYQPLWTLVGGGLADVARSRRPQSSVMPKGVTWIRGRAAAVDPEACTVTLEDGRTVGYEYLVMAPGIQLNWGGITGLPDALGRDGVSSNYDHALAPRTWDFVRATTRGTAVFAQPAGAIKCAGAPQKIAYLAADYWRRQGVLKDIDVHLVLPTPGMFGVPEFARILEQVVERYGITVHFNSEVVEVDGATREVIIRDNANDTKERLGYQVFHAVPPQSAPDWVRQGPLADTSTPAGYVALDKHTLRHVTYGNVFGLGDAGSTPNSKTGAAVRHQAPVLVKNLQEVMSGREPSAEYDGYASCPLTTARDRMLLAEFDYSLKPAPSIPILDTTHEHRDFGLLKKYGLPTLYWNLMLKGLA
ncbi:FAD/NAD(P)-binding oxidoreductase [Kineosporia sp. A_224]|uniref:NAD(P)/FAD-dependent oxidoreductase n=1 Tax=Kineosporia sp. A_224 TaxID=1962180 RepID=UPI000B4A770F|nr:FAD/NAD(P)-binding oxidoreductase [Kineosporia sp. A_224]